MGDISVKLFVIYQLLLFQESVIFDGCWDFVPFLSPAKETKLSFHKKSMGFKIIAIFTNSPLNLTQNFVSLQAWSLHFQNAGDTLLLWLPMTCRWVMLLTSKVLHWEIIKSHISASLKTVKNILFGTSGWETINLLYFQKSCYKKFSRFLLFAPQQSMRHDFQRQYAHP